MPFRLPIVAFLLAAAPALAGPVSLAETAVQLAGSRYTVEIADSEHARMRGLMFREALPAGRGMLFVFEREQPLAFWMKNTKIPLDILYFDDRLRLVSFVTAPPCATPYCPAYASSKPARFVLELNAGEADRLGVEPGATLEVMAEGGTDTTLD